MLVDIKYRRYDQLLDSVKIDLRSYDLEGMFDSQEYIKVAARVTDMLGLKINPNRGKVLEIVNGKVRLPNDFHKLNFAVVCTNRHSEISAGAKSYTDGFADGAAIFEAKYKICKTGTFCPESTFSTTITLNPGSNTIVHNLGTQDLLIEAFDSTGDEIFFDVIFVNDNEITVISNMTVSMTDIKFTITGGHIEVKDLNCFNQEPSPDPFDLIMQNQCSPCSAKVVENPYGNPFVRYNKFGTNMEFRTLTPIQMEKHRLIEDEFIQSGFKCHEYKGSIKDGFLVVNFNEGTIFIDYQSLMEDDDGNLLVIDHPRLNEYYEYAIKERFFENMMFNGEPTTQMLQYTQLKLREARNIATGYVNTPDFGEMKKMWETNRKAQYSKYYYIFK